MLNPREFNVKVVHRFESMEVEKVVYKDALAGGETHEAAEPAENTEEPILSKEEPDDLPF